MDMGHWWLYFQIFFVPHCSCVTAHMIALRDTHAMRPRIPCSHVVEDENVEKPKKREETDIGYQANVNMSPLPLRIQILFFLVDLIAKLT